MDEKTIELIDKINIKNDEELNMEINKVAATINAINKESVKKNDFDLLKSENAELKSALEVNQADIVALRALKDIRFTSKSNEEKMHSIGKFLFAMRHNNVSGIKDMGGFIQANAKSLDDWKGVDWNVNAAPDLGTALRGDTTTGSYLIPTEFASEILRIPEDPSSLMGQVRTIPMNSRSIRFPAKLAGASFTWVTNEITAKTETKPTFSYVDLACETAAAWIAFSDEMDEDSLAPLGTYFTELYREAWQTEFDLQCLNSDTAPFVGVLQNAGVNSLSMGAGSAGFSDITMDDIKDLASQLTTKAKRMGGKYIMHMTVLDMIKKLKDDNGNYIYREANVSEPATLNGYGIITSDAMPDADDSAASTAFIAFGNPKHIMHGDRVGMEFKLFDQTADGMVYDRLFLRARLRQAFVTGIPSAFAVLKTSA